MKTNNRGQEVEHKDNGSNLSSAVAGLVIGGLAGAGAALLLAPQSGKETREQIQQKTVEIRDRTTETVGDAVAQVKSKTHQIKEDVQDKAHQITAGIQHKTDQIKVGASDKADQIKAEVNDKVDQIKAEVHYKAEEMQRQGQEMVVDQLDRVSAAAEAGKAAVAPDYEKTTAKRH